MVKQSYTAVARYSCFQGIKASIEIRSSTDLSDSRSKKWAIYEKVFVIVEKKVYTNLFF